MAGNKHLGKRLKEFRLARLWTQKQAAAAIGISLPTYNRMENGHDVTDLTRARIERFLESQTAQVA